MAQKLFIPKKLKIGFQTRTDTFTGKLAYVIYYDEKGKLRKETSWEGWRDSKIEPIEVDNVPQTGFIFNKGVQRSREWFGSGRSVIRVYSPQDFEFEINVDNLINLLMHSDVSKRDIVEPCVFAWAGTELVLLPTNSEDYQESIEYTAKQDKKVSAKSLVKGRQYAARKTDDVYTYIGYFDWWEIGYKREGHQKIGKKHVFHNGKSFQIPSVSTLSHEISDDIVDNYAFLVDDFFKTASSQPIKSFGCEPFIPDPNIKYLSGIYKLEGNTVTYISPNFTSYGELNFSDTYSASEVTIYTHKLAPNESGSFTGHFSEKVVCCSRISSNGHWGYMRDYYVKSHPIFDALKAGINEEKKLTRERYYEILAELGFGTLTMTLENGTVLPNQLRLPTYR